MAKRIIQHYSCKKRKCFRQWTNSKSAMTALMCIFIGVALFVSITGISTDAKTIDSAGLLRPGIPVVEQPVDSNAFYQESIDSIKEVLTNEVASYMYKVYPKTKMSPGYIVDICYEKDFDIPLLLSQARQESIFGKHTGGTNSCFGVINKKYRHVDESVAGYVDLMKRRYVRTRTPEQLISSGFQVEGSRTAKYAEDPNYSQTIGRIRSTIIRTTAIPSHQKLLRQYKERLDSLIKQRSDSNGNRIKKENFNPTDSLSKRILC